MEEALDWWYNVLNEGARNKFPIPESNEDILAYYNNPSEWVYPPNIDY